MLESVARVTGGQTYYRHNGVESARPTILFLHGIGESGLCFLEAFHDRRLDDFNIIIPDLIGFGKSSGADDGDYGFSRQMMRIDELLDAAGVSDFHLVGHSMGGILGTLYCDTRRDRVLSFVNIESDLTPDNRFLIDSAIRSDDEGRFEEWLRGEFYREQIIGICHQWPSTVRYLASVGLCQSEAFIASAREIARWMEPSPDRQAALVGKVYLGLQTRRIYCWGAASLPASARAFLNASGLDNREFSGAFHWLMLDRAEQFYGFLADFLNME